MKILACLCSLFLVAAHVSARQVDEPMGAVITIEDVDPAPADVQALEQLTGQPVTDRVLIIPPGTLTQSQLESFKMQVGGDEAETPVDSEGKPLPPPVTLPPGKNGQKNKWKRVKGTEDRPIKWKPEYPLPSPLGGQPSGSWDPKQKHWDVDNGLPKPDNIRIRVRPDGTIVDHDNNPIPDQLPAPFTGIDWETVAKFATIGIVLLGSAALFWLILIGLGSGWAWALVLPTPADVRPDSGVVQRVVCVAYMNDHVEAAYSVNRSHGMLPTCSDASSASRRWMQGEPCGDFQFSSLRLGQDLDPQQGRNEHEVS